MAAALFLPRLLDRLPACPPILAGAAILAVGRAIGSLAGTPPALMALWPAIGFGDSLAQTLAGRPLRHSARPDDRPALFAEQSALSHACWLITFPLAERLGAGFGLDTTFLVMAVLTALGLGAALRLWPAGELDTLPHAHPDLPPDDRHLRAYGFGDHRHAQVIEDLHAHWPDRHALVRLGPAVRLSP